MIYITMNGMCEGCKVAELRLRHRETFDGKKDWYVECLHEDACDCMETKTIERLKQGNGDEE